MSLKLGVYDWTAYYYTKDNNLVSIKPVYSILMRYASVILIVGLHL